MAEGKQLEQAYAERMARQLPLFGEDGQRRIALTPLSIIGFGGNGSVIALLCALIGFLKLILCDHDRLEIHNLNRFAIGGVRDVGEYKVVVGKRELETRFPGVKVKAIAHDVRTPGVWDSIKMGRWAFDATDDDEARRFIQTECGQRGISLISVGSGFVLRDGALVSAGSRVNRVRFGGDACLECAVLDDEPMDQSPVSLVLPNVVAAALAVDMLVREITGGAATAGDDADRDSSGEVIMGYGRDARTNNFILFNLLSRTLLAERIVPSPTCPACQLLASRAK